MSDTKNDQGKRRPYRKPHLEKVALVAQEAVLANCKGILSSAGKNSQINCRPETSSCKFSFGS